MEQEFGAASVEFHAAEFVDAKEIDAAVAGDGLGQPLVVSGLDELVDKLVGCGELAGLQGNRVSGQRAGTGGIAVGGLRARPPCVVDRGEAVGRAGLDCRLVPGVLSQVGFKAVS